MIKLSGNEIYRNGQEAGWIEGNHIIAHGDRKLGYFEGNSVFSIEGHKLAYMEGNNLYVGSAEVSLDKINKNIIGGSVSEIGRCAIYVLIGV